MIILTQFRKNKTLIQLYLKNLPCNVRKEPFERLIPFLFLNVFINIKFITRSALKS